jgi:hypothetical protein
VSETLPPNPSLDHLKYQARNLQRAYAAGDGEAIARIEKHLPDYSGELKLTKAQTIIAREYGFDSWAKLRTHIFEPVDQFCAVARAQYLPKAIQ